MLSVVIPTDCERENIEPLLMRLSAMAPHLGEPMEVLIVDNRSDDGTSVQARRLLGGVIQGRVIECARKVDLAGAVMRGIVEAKGDVIGVMDADLSHPPELLPELIRAVRAGSQVAVASRYVAGGGIMNWPWKRRALSRIGNLLARPLTRVSDATSGYFLFHGSLMRSLLLQPRGFKILLEVLVRGNVRAVQEVPYVFQDRLHGSSKLGTGVLWCYVVQLSQLYLYRLNRFCQAPLACKTHG
mgnify:FL=1